MPVYIRKNVSFTPPSIYNMQLEDDSDYLLDPDQLRDILPQPYRMIDKILTQLVDKVWEIVETKDNAVLAEARKVRPPRFEENQRLEQFDNACSMTNSSDGKLIFFGLPNGLAVMEALSENHLDSWHQDYVKITSIKCHTLGEDIHLVVTTDDMGTARMFLYAYEKIFFIKALNENTPESTSKILCQKCEASLKGEYVGVLFENTGNKDIWLEVHKLPVETWLSEVEAFGTSTNKQKDQKDKAEELKDLENNSVPETEVEQPSVAPATVPSEIVSPDKSAVKFSLPVQVLKIKQPPEQGFTGNPSSSVGSALSKLDQGEVLGTGLQHILSSAHLESLDSMFKHKHMDNLKYLPEEKEERVVQCNFHFLSASCMIPVSQDQLSTPNSPACIAVWWAGSPHLSQYSLFKTGKDLEFKPDIVWPFTSAITCSATSECTTYIAIGLETGNVVLWNRQIGINKAVLSASSRSAVKSITFLDPCLFPADALHYPPYPTTSATFLLAECTDGTQVLFDTCDGSQQIPRTVAQNPENDEDLQHLIKTVPGLPEVMMYTQKDGNLYIKDIGTGAAICQICLPSTHTLQHPWDPIFALGGGGQILFVKGEGTEMDEEGEATDISGIFVYHLRSYPLLDKYWQKDFTGKQLEVYTTADQRVAPLMQERLQQQALRKPRLQQRWTQLRAELDVIQMAHTAHGNTMRITF